MLNRLRRNIRQALIEKGIWEIACAPYGDNPLHVDPSKASRQTYLDLSREARKRAHPEFLAKIQNAFGYLPDDEFVHELALSTQVVVKQSKILYLHGYLLYGALRHYLSEAPDLKSINILETGTARGFGTVCMARALKDAGRHGKITTVNILPSQKPIYWNCIHDIDGKKTRFQLLERWKDLVEDHIIFLQGYTNIVLRQIGLSRIHFAFLDSGHDYKTLKLELDHVAQCQQPGDIIVCDDYTPAQFPGVVKAVDELLSGGMYEGRLFESKGGRGYMYCRKLKNGL